MITQDQIIELAKEAGLKDWTDDGNWSCVDDDLFRFANLVAQHQKEQDARICESMDHLVNASHCAAAIRSQE